MSGIPTNAAANFGSATEYQAAAPAKPSAPFSWYVFAFYCVMVTLVSIFMTGLGMFASVNPDVIAERPLDEATKELWTRFGLVMAVICFLMAVAHSAALVYREGRGSWIFALVLIGLGMTGACSFPFCLFMLIAFLGQRVKDYYGLYRLPAMEYPEEEEQQTNAAPQWIEEPGLPPRQA